MTINVLRAALTGSDTVSGRQSEEAQGTLIIALDVAQLRDLDDYTAQVEEFIAHVKSSELEPGARAIRAPGESAPSPEAMAEDTEIRLNAVTTGHLHRIAQQLGIEPPASR
ncbi:hypothetical protein AOZ07_16365 [Glutamicibacter halophytocola]|nr:hypothetical protein AOZ07_16365 [Glutamicibacter halophytocola]